MYSGFSTPENTVKQTLVIGWNVKKDVIISPDSDDALICSVCSDI